MGSLPSTARDRPRTSATDHLVVDLRPTVMLVQDGELVDAGSWVYVWLRAAQERRVIYVGGTGLQPATRVWLHLHHGDPEIGRVAAAYPAAGGNLREPLEVLAFGLPDGVPRRDVRDAVIRRLAAAGMLSDHYCGHAAVEADEAAPVTALADALLVELRRRWLERPPR